MQLRKGLTFFFLEVLALETLSSRLNNTCRGNSIYFKITKPYQVETRAEDINAVLPLKCPMVGRESFQRELSRQRQLPVPVQITRRRLNRIHSSPWEGPIPQPMFKTGGRCLGKIKTQYSAVRISCLPIRAQKTLIHVQAYMILQMSPFFFF